MELPEETTPRCKDEALTEALRQWSEDAGNAAAEAVPLIYEELRRIATGYFRRERPEHTLQATAVVHEIYIRLVEEAAVCFHNRAHFVGKVAHMMRRFLIEHARRHNAAKRGGGWQRLPLGQVDALLPGPSFDLVALDDALQSLAQVDPRKVRLVELHFFGGLTLAESAAALGISRTSTVNELRRARAWLYRELTGSAPSAMPAAAP